MMRRRRTAPLPHPQREQRAAAAADEAGGVTATDLNWNHRLRIQPTKSPVPGKRYRAACSCGWQGSKRGPIEVVAEEGKQHLQQEKAQA